MQALQFLKTVTADKSNLLERLLRLLNDNNIQYCVIGGVAVSAFVEPMVSLDFALIITSYQMGRFESLLASTFIVRRSSRLIEITAAESRLRANVHTESRYAEFVERAEQRVVFDLDLPVARLEDVMRARVWDWQDVSRKATIRMYALADIARLLESYPKLKPLVPPDALQRLAMVGVSFA